GTTPLATLPHGAEVEILGWQPRGASGTRYSIRSSESGVEGWVGGDSLRAPAPPPPSETIVSAASLVEGARPPKASTATPRRSGERAPTKAARGRAGDVMGSIVTQGSPRGEAEERVRTIVEQLDRPTLALLYKTLHDALGFRLATVDVAIGKLTR